MKPLLQKLPLTGETSFVAQTFRTPHFEVGWHQHPEYELILFTEGAGMCFIGNHVGEFETGDVYFLGSNLPHTFQKSGEQITSAIVIQFREDFWGKDFLQLPEHRGLRETLNTSCRGLKITGECIRKITAMIVALETATGHDRILLLLQCLYAIADSGEHVPQSTEAITLLQRKDHDCINRVFEFTINSFRDPVTLKQVAGIACMSIPAFCNYFKRSTKKTYIDFLNEVRISYACSLLVDTDKPVLEIGYESGYNTTANFHKQFMRLKEMSPLKYRRMFKPVQFPTLTE